ncbi:MAG: Fur family transcriptional regulator [Dysosmobacter sp.]
MSSYSTRQRKALLAYLSRHPDELLSARQIADALVDEKISLSAVYRNLAQLEAEEKGAAARAARGRSTYQYLDAESCKGALHMSCVKCGRTFHMASGNAALFAKHLAQSEQFTLDAADTVLYGICADCREE